MCVCVHVCVCVCSRARVSVCISTLRPADTQDIVVISLLDDTMATVWRIDPDGRGYFMSALPTSCRDALAGVSDEKMFRSQLIMFVCLVATLS